MTWRSWSPAGPAAASSGTTGAETLATGAGLPQQVRVMGYPDGSEPAGLL